jgi:hypothetical protein
VTDKEGLRVKIPLEEGNGELLSITRKASGERKPPVGSAVPRAAVSP